MRFHLNHKAVKFICGSMAAVLTVTGVCAAALSYSNEAYAKASLQSIENIVTEAAQKDEAGEYVNPITILEVVPDVVTPDNNTVRNAVGESTEIALVSDKDTITFVQSMGTAGYYVKGEEAVTKDLEKYLSDHIVTVDGTTVHYKTTVSDYAARKELAQRLLTSVEGKSWVGSAREDETPVYTVGDYAEIRLGQYFPLDFTYDFDKDGKIGSDERYESVNEELIGRLLQSNKYYPIFRDYTGKVYNPSGTKKDAFIDVAEGYMEAVPMGEGAYTLSYEPKLNAEGKVDTGNDNAYLAVSGGSSSAFEVNTSVGELDGEFDPYLLYDTGNATHRATFAYVEGAASGYRITNTPSAVTDLSAVAMGTPLYVYDTDINQYVLAGYVGEKDGSRCVVLPEDEELAGLYFLENTGNVFSLFPRRIMEANEVSAEEAVTDEIGAGDTVTEGELGENPDGAGVEDSLGDNSEEGAGDNSGAGTGDNSGDGTGDNSGDGVGDDSEDGNGDDSEDGAGDDSGDGGGDNSEDGNGDDSEDGAGDDSGDGGGDNSGDGTGDNSEGDDGDSSGDDNGDDDGDDDGDDSEDGAGDNSGDSSGDEVAAANFTEKLTVKETYVPMQKYFTSVSVNTPLTRNANNVNAAADDVQGSTQDETAKASEMKILAENGYYLLEFEYVEEGDGVSGLYQVSGFDTDGEGAQYCAALETAFGEPLSAIIPNERKTGTVSLADYDAVKNQMIYDYKEEGGYYRFIGENWCDESGYTAEKCSIRGAQIYFTTGLENNDWFKQYALDRTPQQCADVAVEVITLPAAKVTIEDIESSDMLLLNSCDESVCLVGSKMKNYSIKTNDLSEEVCNRILEKVVTESFPVVSDYGALGDKGTTKLVTGSDPNIFYMMKAFTLDEGKNSLSTYFNNYLMLNATNLTAADPTDLFSNLTANNYNFVNAGVYTFCDANDSESPFAGMRYLNETFNDVIEDENVITNGFVDVLLDIQNENIYRKTAGLEETISETISQATVIRYILGYSTKRGFEVKSSLSILEIEPCASYSLSVEHTYADEENTEVETVIIREKGDPLLTLEGTKVTLTQMTTAEFIGRIEDINAHYDLIYIGDNVGLMNRDSSNKTIYNDEDMNGMIYTNVGDTFIGNANDLNGLIESDNNEVSCRFPGNDITEEKYNALSEFVKAGYPVVIADGLMTVDDTKTVTVDAKAVDCNSYLYKFLTKNIEKENMFLVSSMSESLLAMYANLSRPSIELTKTSSEDDEELTDWYRATQEVVELQRDSDGFYRAEYKFKIENKGIAASDTTFDCKLYVDINSDGKYSFSTEEIKDIYVTDHNGSEMTADDKGRYRLKAGKTYKVSYTLANTFHGVIPWRLRVTQNDETHLRRSDVTGYYVVNGEKNKKVSVLQIDTRSTKTSTWDMEQSIAADSKTVFKALLEDKTVVPYDVDIKTISADNLTLAGTEEKFGIGKGITDADNNGSISVAEYLAFFRKFDMLVLGYADTYAAPTDTNALEAVKIYAREGRSVLFTHDTSSFYNEGNHWGVEYNSILRNLFGMDRYNIMEERDEDEDDTFKIERAYIPGNTSKEEVEEIQGYNYTTPLYRASGKSQYTMLDGMTYNYNSTYVTKYVQELNNGQITMYPYKLDGGTFEVAKTHAQYYQLDFSQDEDRDGESDIVVWYTLAGTNLYDKSPRDARNNYYIYNKGNITYSGVGHSKVCTAQATYDENGNVVVEAETKEINEVKLFINTLIAAYESGLHNPKVEIIEGYNENSRSINSLYVSYDDQLQSVNDERITGGVVDGVKDIYFKTESASLVRVDSNTTHDFNVKIYVEVPEGTAGAKLLEVDGSMVYGKEIEIGTSDGSTPGTYDNRLYYQVTDGENVAEVIADKVDGKYQLQSGVVYKTSIPVSALADFNNFIFKEELSDEIAEVEEEAVGRNTRRIFVEATETVSNSKADTTTSASATDVVSVVRVQLFDLD